MFSAAGIVEMSSSTATAVSLLATLVAPIKTVSRVGITQAVAKFRVFDPEWANAYLDRMDSMVDGSVVDVEWASGDVVEQDASSAAVSVNVARFTMVVEGSLGVNVKRARHGTIAFGESAGKASVNFIVALLAIDVYLGMLNPSTFPVSDSAPTVRLILLRFHLCIIAAAICPAQGTFLNGRKCRK